MVADNNMTGLSLVADAALLPPKHLTPPFRASWCGNQPTQLETNQTVPTVAE
jgi:hypothetical protein